MMKITKNIGGSTLTFALEERLDGNTSPEFETEIKTSLNGISNLILDFEKLVYISSAGLRVVLTALKIMNKQGEMVV